MGNQQSHGGPQFCSIRPNPLATRFMVDKDFRVNYTSFKTQNTESMRLTEQRQLGVVRQQRMPDSGRQQQVQEESIDMLLRGPVTLKKPTINMQVKEEPDAWVWVDAKEISKACVFEGIFGTISLTANGFVQYTDINATDFFEKYESDTIQKTFPMGISFGGLSKSLWFKNGDERDECFEIMAKNLPHFYASVIANPENYNVPGWLIPPKKNEDSSSMKVFDGIQGNDVVVYQNDTVQYTDLDGIKHSVVYKRHAIQKCFPQGICFGGLDRVIWLTDEIERDLCFTFMQVTGEFKEEKEEVITFPGLYGSVVLKEEKLNFTSLVGERITAVCYDPKSIYRVFPLGISGGGLPYSIWFKDINFMENCFNAMEQKGQ